MEERPDKQQEILLYFFEAYAIFEATILSAVFKSVSNEDGNIDNISLDYFKKASFGSWIMMDQAIARVFREMLGSPDKIDKALDAFHTSDASIVRAICNKDVFSILQMACNYRNTWKGHSGITSDVIYKHSETVINKNANDFFSKYQKYQKEHHSSLELVTSKKANGYWACYRTHFGPHVYLYHKINEGQVQLIFNHMADELEKLEYVACWAKKHGIVNAAAVQTGESAALRIYVPDMNMQKSFDDYVDDQVPKCFKAIEKLIALANMAHTISRLDYSNGYNK